MDREHDPLAVDADTMRRHRVRDGRFPRRSSDRVRSASACAGQPGGDGRAHLGGAARRARGLRHDPASAARRRAAVHVAQRAPPLLRVHPVKWHVALGARRFPRRRDKRVLRQLDGVGRSEPGRAGRAAMVRRLVGSARIDRRRSRQRGLGGEHDGAGRRTRTCRRGDDRRHRRVRIRPSALLARAGRANPRFPSGSATRDPRRRRLRHARRRARRRDPGRCRARAPPHLRIGRRRGDQQRQRRPARVDRRHLRRARDVDAR